MRCIFLPEIKGAGDVVHLFAYPVAVVVDAATAGLPKKARTNLKNCHGCGQRREKLNQAVAFK